MTDDEVDVAGVKSLRLIAESDSLKCSFEIGPGAGEDGEVRFHAITIWVEEKDRAR